MIDTPLHDDSSESVLDVERATVIHPGSEVPAVDDVSLSLSRDRVLGLVGSSGCGKTSLSRAIMHLIPLANGRIRILGEEPGIMKREARRRFRRRFQMVFQDPGGSLDSRMRAVDLVAEPLKVHGMARGPELRERAVACLESVDIPSGSCDRYPHQFSGGQRQRLAIARAFVRNAPILVLDEATAALDSKAETEVQAAIDQLSENRTVLCVAHRLSTLRTMDRIIVLSRGQTIEEGTFDELLEKGGVFCGLARAQGIAG